MQSSDDFFVKNILEGKKIYLRLSPVSFPKDKFTYRVEKVISASGSTVIEDRCFTYDDILHLYDEGFHSVDQYEFERVKAQANIKITK